MKPKSSRWLAEKRRVDARVYWMIKNQVNWMMPTISPAPKDMETGEIESIRKALEIYAPYTKWAVCQTKWMGSYVCAYIENIYDISETRFFSRNGYLIDHLDREKLLKAFQPVYDFIYDKETHFKLHPILVECELLPWRAMGHGLIEKEYNNYYLLHKDRLEYLKKTNLSSYLDKVKGSEVYKKWKEDPEEQPQHFKRQYEALDILDEIVPNLGAYENSINLYKRQYDIFGYEGEYEFKPFNILKMGDRFGDNNLYFGTYYDSDINFYRVDDIDAFYNFYEKKIKLEHEGIMIKPYQTRLINLPPAIKVRSKNYLQLIYGVNFDRDYDYYLERRRIGSKMKTSIADYETALQLLAIPKEKLVESNEHYVNLLYKAIDSENFVKTLDTRL